MIKTKRGGNDLFQIKTEKPQKQKIPPLLQLIKSLGVEFYYYKLIKFSDLGII